MKSIVLLFFAFLLSTFNANLSSKEFTSKKSQARYTAITKNNKKAFHLVEKNKRRSRSKCKAVTLSSIRELKKARGAEYYEDDNEIRIISSCSIHLDTKFELRTDKDLFLIADDIKIHNKAVLNANRILINTNSFYASKKASLCASLVIINASKVKHHIGSYCSNAELLGTLFHKEPLKPSLEISVNQEQDKAIVTFDISKTFGLYEEAYLVSVESEYREKIMGNEIVKEFVNEGEYSYYVEFFSNDEKIKSEVRTFNVQLTKEIPLNVDVSCYSYLQTKLYCALDADSEGRFVSYSWFLNGVSYDDKADQLFDIEDESNLLVKVLLKDPADQIYEFSRSLVFEELDTIGVLPSHGELLVIEGYKGFYPVENANIKLKLENAKISQNPELNVVRVHDDYINLPFEIIVNESNTLALKIDRLKNGKNDLTFQVIDEEGRVAILEKTIWAGARNLKYSVIGTNGEALLNDIFYLSLPKDENVYFELKSLDGHLEILNVPEEDLLVAFREEFVSMQVVNSDASNFGELLFVNEVEPNLSAVKYEERLGAYVLKGSGLVADNNEDDQNLGEKKGIFFVDESGVLSISGKIPKEKILKAGIALPRRIRGNIGDYISYAYIESDTGKVQFKTQFIAGESTKQVSQGLYEEFVSALVFPSDLATGHVNFALVGKSHVEPQGFFSKIVNFTAWNANANTEQFSLECHKSFDVDLVSPDISILDDRNFTLSALSVGRFSSSHNYSKNGERYNPISLTFSVISSNTNLNVNSQDLELVFHTGFNEIERLRASDVNVGTLTEGKLPVSATFRLPEDFMIGLDVRTVDVGLSIRNSPPLFVRKTVPLLISLTGNGDLKCDEDYLRYGSWSCSSKSRDTDYGGDDYYLPSLDTHIQELLLFRANSLYATSGEVINDIQIRVNDFSNLNGGYFGRNSPSSIGHRWGDQVDLRFAKYKELKGFAHGVRIVNDKLSAQALVQIMNTSVGSTVKTIKASYSLDSDFGQTLATSCIADDRYALDVVRNDFNGGHGDHIDLQFMINRQNYEIQTISIPSSMVDRDLSEGQLLERVGNNGYVYRLKESMINRNNFDYYLTYKNRGSDGAIEEIIYPPDPLDSDPVAYLNNDGTYTFRDHPLRYHLGLIAVSKSFLPGTYFRGCKKSNVKVESGFCTDSQYPRGYNGIVTEENGFISETVSVEGSGEIKVHNGAQLCGSTRVNVGSGRMNFNENAVIWNSVFEISSNASDSFIEIGQSSLNRVTVSHTGSGATSIWGAQVKDVTFLASALPNGGGSSNSIMHSTLANMQIYDSSVTESELSFALLEGSHVYRMKFEEGEILGYSAIAESDIRNSVIDRSQVFHSTVIGSRIIQSTVQYSGVNSSTISYSGVLNSNIVNSTLSGTQSVRSSIFSSYLVNSISDRCTISGKVASSYVCPEPPPPPSPDE